MYGVSGEDKAMLWDDGVLASYRTDKTACDVNIYIDMSDTLRASEGELIYSDEYRQVYRIDDDTYIRYEGVVGGNLGTAYMRIERSIMRSDVQVKPLSLGSKSVLAAMELEHFAVVNTGVLFHGATILHNGKAIVFTAPSGTGKSTQAELWCRHRGAMLINGDRCVLMRKGDDYFMCGVPYSGSSRVSKNLCVPLESVVYLTQAKNSVARKVRGINSFMHLWEGCCINTWNNGDVEKSIDFITHLCENVSIIRLDCTPDVSAVEALETALRSEQGGR